MKIARNRIDQSVKILKENRKIRNFTQEEKLKSVLVERLSAEYADLDERMVYLAVNEADALASQTFAPLLVLPTLAEEKVQQAAAWAVHQRTVLGADHLAFAA